MADETYENYSSELTDADIQVAVGDVNEPNPQPPIAEVDTDDEGEKFIDDQTDEEDIGLRISKGADKAGGVPRRLSRRLSRRSSMRAPIGGGLRDLPEMSEDIDKMPSEKNPLGKTYASTLKKKQQGVPMVRLALASETLQGRIAAKKLLRELALYFVYMWLMVTVMLMGRYIKHVYLIQQSVDSLFVTQEFPPSAAQYRMAFMDIGNAGEFWSWVQGPLLMGLTQSTWYNGQPYDKFENQTLLYFNKLVGAVRFRQIRVKRESCQTPDHFANYFTHCYGYYNFWNKDTEPFGPPSNPTKYKYTGDVDGGRLRFALAAGAYPSSGYIVDIPPTADFAAAFQELMDDRWVDQQTRAIFITINTLNVGLVEHATVSTFILEQTAGGIYLPNRDLRTMRLHLYISPYDYFRLFLEISLLVFFGYWLFKLVLELIFAYRNGILKKYFTADPWNILEVFNLLLIAVVVSLTIAFLIATTTLGNNLDRESFMPWETWSTVYTTIYDIDAFIVLILFVKMFKFLRVNRRLSMLWSTLGRASSDLLAFLFLFLIIFMGFTFTGYLIWGPYLSEWSTVWGSFEILFQMTLGDSVVNEYNSMVPIHRILTPLYFFIFVFLLFFALVNMFLAIINDAYAKEQLELHDRERKKKKMMQRRKRLAAAAGYSQKKLSLWQKLKHLVLRKSYEGDKKITNRELLAVLNKQMNEDRREAMPLDEFKESASRKQFEHLLLCLELEDDKNFELDDEHRADDQYSQISFIAESQRATERGLNDISQTLDDLLDSLHDAVNNRSRAASSATLPNQTARNGGSSPELRSNPTQAAAGDSDDQQED
eukprot:TRINITY_DN8898_c0_g1_i1.p1 TRINITY_DN8898_c0_g1~~TRINITY_DN8898_c0_g1_i1.p1  ORF type:complete len:824 (-),score=205.14 TRINITY_DN8898_c0_g1_i1:71-2542(-)